MTQFFVNGTAVETEQTGSLLPFLRDTLSLRAVKCGCMQGSCGTCSVLVDGALRRSCVLRIEKLGGCRILTPEGLSERERAVYTYALAEAGAVQCGYCLPGFTMAIKALLDRESDPDDAAIRRALDRNLCRCTGYAALVRATRLIAALLRSGAPVPEPAACGVGSSVHRADAAEKVLGTLRFAADDVPEGALYGAVRLAGVPHARILDIDTSRAAALPGVKAVLTAKDVPGSPLSGGEPNGWPVLRGVGEEVLFPGDCVALVAAEDEATARRAAELVDARLEPLRAVFDPAEAMRPDAPKLRPGGNRFFRTELHYGDAEAARRATVHEFCETYTTPFAEHAYLETEACVVIPENGRLRVKSADQGAFRTRQKLAGVLGCAEEELVVEGLSVGGAFGGREDVVVQAQAALLARAADRPVLLRYSREESLQIHAKRHPMTITAHSGCDADGHLTFLKLDVRADKGAYASLGIPVLERACSMAPGPYRYGAVDVVGESWYTNNPPTGSFRGFGIVQTGFAVESNLNQLARMAGLSPWEIRFRNAVAPGETLYNEQIADESTAIREALLAVKEPFERARFAGIACGMKNCGSGWGMRDVGRCVLRVHHGHVFLFSAAGRTGQGVETVLLQIAATASGVAPQHFRLGEFDTDAAPDTGMATASRMTLIAGEAARRAGEALRGALAALPLAEEDALAVLEGREFPGEYAAETERPDADGGHPVLHAAYGYAAHVAVLDEHGRVERIIAADDVGRAINPASARGQIEGGAVMSFGFALTEHLHVHEGRVDPVFSHVGVPRASDAPEVEAILIERSPLERAYGAKGLGELTCIPTPAAIAGAYQAYDGVLRTRLPLEHTPYSGKGGGGHG